MNGGPESKGQGHSVTKTVTVASDHVPYSVTQYAAVLSVGVAGVVLHVDTTAYVFWSKLFCTFTDAKKSMKKSKLYGCIAWNAHNTVFGSKCSAVCAQAVYFLHSTRPS